MPILADMVHYDLKRRGEFAGRGIASTAREEAQVRLGQACQRVVTPFWRWKC